MGLANCCVPDEELMDRTLELAKEVVQNSWHTLRADKSLILGGQQQHLDDGLQYERDNSPGAGPDMAERLAQFGRKSSSTPP